MSERRSREDQIAQRLKATEERFRFAQVAGGIGWFEWDLETDTWEWTPHVAVLFGFDPEDPRPHLADWQPAIFIDDLPKLWSAVEAAGAKASLLRRISSHSPGWQRPLDCRQGRSNA